MKIDKLNIDGKKDTIDISEKIVAARVNEKLVSHVLYKTNANYKGRKAKTKQKNDITGSTSTSLWTHYNNGERTYCGINFPDGLRKNQKLDTPVLTPTTKDEFDLPISVEETKKRRKRKI